MYPITDLYTEYLKRHDREFLVKVLVDDVEYDNSVIVDFSIENSLTLSGEFEIGTAIPSKLTLRMRLKDPVPANAQVIPFISLSLAGMTWAEAHYPWEELEIPWVNGRTEWLPLGEFFIDNRVKINDVWEFTCYDKLVYADVAYISSLTYPTTQQAVFDEICDSLGYVYDASVVIDAAYTVPVAPTGYRAREVLAYIASANSASIFVDKDGMLKFKRFDVADVPVFEFLVSDYIRAKQTNPLKTYTRVVVTYDTTDQLSYEAGTGDENHTLYTVNPFATQAIVDALHVSLNGINYSPLAMDARGFPQLEHGDVIGFDKNESSSWEETDPTWEDMDLSWDGLVGYKSINLHQVLDFKGGLQLKVEAPSKSDQSSEFAFEGSLTTLVKTIDKTAIKENKKYYGVIINRTQGIVVERDDHASKVVLNSDELSFYVGADRALWFDLPSLKFKFSGTLEAANGSFSGTISASDIIGGTITGPLIRTSASYPRIELSSTGNLLSAATDSTHSLEFIPSMSGVPGLSFASPGGRTNIIKGAFFTVSSDIDILLTSVSNTRLTAGTGGSGKVVIDSPSGITINGVNSLAGTKVYYVSDTSGGATTRKLTFTDGILTKET